MSVRFNIIFFYAFLLIAISVCTGYIAAGSLQKRKLYRRFKHGRDGEEKAEDYFSKRGFKISGKQVSAESYFLINNRKSPFQTRVDLIAQKNGKNHVIEVKTGKNADPSISANTRRQLFEYCKMYNTDTIILFNADSNGFQEIRFPESGGGAYSRKKNCLHFYIAGLISGFTAALLFRILTI